MPMEPAEAPARRWRLLKSVIIVCGTIVAAVYTAANVFALYYAKAYLLDRPALTVNMHAGQIDATDNQRYLLVTLEFENNGIRPYNLTLRNSKPITVARAAHDGKGELSYQIVKQLSLPSVYPDGAAAVVKDINGMYFSPGEKGKGSVATPVSEAGLYFIEFNATVVYRSLVWEYIWRRIVSEEPQPSWLSANSYVYVK